ncbi:folylpolyglutamate synthase/dihydrofolate synthase [Bernardetia litoralis DSM 6794]|uniref:Dihydrofolate synthase/folylpolyglutamate synthase n=1 Tax=Bernardetia litoralis (strain ATCC 23117 / DSM 6794 / NBRC 15988 / NCIMB 1366 / Fx l1 / Sio-4) TaxID=880071 RepID=I4ANT4_BERLS|nr:folylpolyglutamate synthase/dihydrofolate synthase family protein [Bernardetia litoralis]AFM05619.1 folylpolyglutamate synthase/dihydrofolate synthase [Bernardetia litoralis DSM 6794]
MLNYQETLDYLFSQLPMFQRVGGAAYRNDLENIKILCKQLGNPENKFDTIHVAGTNGKGSTSHMIASVLQSAGYNVGLYTSPHLRNFTERIRLNGQEIEQDFVIDFVKKIRTTITDISPSFFEVTVAMAFEYFAYKKVDIAIIEVGMGGRLDATNVILPLLSVITNIGFDHQQFLGDTLAKIAAEKAGIIKPNTPVISSQKQEETTVVFQEIAQKNNSELIFATDTFEVSQTIYAYDDDSKKNNFDISTITNHENLKAKEYKYLYTDIELDLKGIYQKQNLLGVICTLEKLKTIQSTRKNDYFIFSEENIIEGLKYASQKTGLKGRWYKLNEENQKPIIICDIAHNEDGINQVISQLKLELKKQNYSTLRIIFGAVNDKDLDKIFNLLKKELQEKITQKILFYFCKPDVPRGLEANILKSKAKEFNLEGEIYESVNSALEVAKKDSQLDKNQNDFIYVGGSAFVVAEVV